MPPSLHAEHPQGEVAQGGCSIHPRATLWLFSQTASSPMLMGSEMGTLLLGIVTSPPQAGAPPPCMATVTQTRSRVGALRSGSPRLW